MIQDSRELKTYPLFLDAVYAGFPSPASDLIDKSIDLNEHLIRHPAATYFMRVRGDSMINAGIFDDDMLVVDKSLQPRNGTVVIASIDGEFIVKKFKKVGNEIYLLPANPHYEAIKVQEESDFEIWGVVTHAVHTLNNTFNY